MSDKLLRSRDLVCQNCGTELQLPSYTNLAIIAVVLVSWVLFPMLGIDTAGQIVLGLGIFLLVGIMLVIMPLQRK
jgi:hypothetical protein